MSTFSLADDLFHSGITLVVGPSQSKVCSYTHPPDVLMISPPPAVEDVRHCARQSRSFLRSSCVWRLTLNCVHTRAAFLPTGEKKKKRLKTIKVMCYLPSGDC